MTLESRLRSFGDRIAMIGFTGFGHAGCGWLVFWERERHFEPSLGCGKWVAVLRCYQRIDK